MIRLQVPLQQPCYDFSFLQTLGFAELQASETPSEQLTKTSKSVGATGGVYKGQGHSQRAFIKHTYKTFLVHGGQLQTPIPTTSITRE